MKKGKEVKKKPEAEPLTKDLFKLEVKVKEQGRNLVGFRTEWLSGSYGKTKFQMCSGAGCGNDAIFLSATRPNGETVRHIINVSELMKDWLIKIDAK